MGKLKINFYILWLHTKRKIAIYDNFTEYVNVFPQKMAY